MKKDKIFLAGIIFVSIIILGILVYNFIPKCGDGKIGSGETCSNCPQDVKCAPDEKCEEGKCLRIHFPNSAISGLTDIIISDWEATRNEITLVVSNNLRENIGLAISAEGCASDTNTIKASEEETFTLKNCQNGGSELDKTLTFMYTNEENPSVRVTGEGYIRTVYSE